MLAALIAASMALSALFTLAPLFAFLSTGARVILLTVALSALAAWRFPVEEEAQP